MVDDEAFSQVLEKVYAATLSDAFWPDALRAVAGLFGSTFAHFEVLDKATGLPVFHRNEGATPEVLDRYARYYSAVSPRVAAGKRQRAGSVCYDYAILSEAEIDRDEYYSDFMQPMGYRYFLSANLINSERLFSVFSVQRRIEQGHADAREIALMERLAPHLVQALRIHLHLAGTQSGGAAGQFLFENSVTGIVFLDSSGAVTALNAAATRLMADPRSGLDVQHGQLTTDQPGAAAPLNGLIARAIATATGKAFDVAGAIAVARPDALPLTIVAVPLPNVGPLAILAGAPVLAVLISDPHACGTLPDDLLRAVYRLTPTECRVARALVAGQTPTEYAEAASVGIRTVRTHISRILAKTGARNQMEMIRLLGGVPYRFG